MTEKNLKEFSIHEVEKHNTADDCWTVIEGKVYDITQFIEKHPGGIIILTGAGNDATVMFNNYHFIDMEKARAVMKKYEIGVVTDKKSPVMGPFYKELTKRVAEVLKPLPRHPMLGLVLLFLDSFLMIFLPLLTLYLSMNNMMTPFLLVLLPFMIDMTTSRIAGQAHALGHMHLTGKDHVEWLMELLIVLTRSAHAYQFPSRTAVFRTKLNEKREVSQYEFSSGRGPFEHQAIHHVKGAALKHDKCKKFITFQGLFRLSAEEEFMTHNSLQKYSLFRNILLIIIEFAQLLSVTFRVDNLKTVLKFKQYGRVPAALIGIFYQFIIGYTTYIVPFQNLYSALALVVIRRIFSFTMLFYAQHDWEMEITEEQADSDWARFNAISSKSLWGASMWWHPVLLGTLNGSCPSTLTYHWEHTLFPGVNYLYLPVIAPVCEQVSKEFGIEYKKIVGISDLNKAFADNCEKYATPAAKVIKVD